MTNTDKDPSPYVSDCKQVENTRRLDSVQAAQEMRQQAEDSLQENQAKKPKKLAPMSADETEIVLHELRVHQIELEMQNVELRRTQVELDAMRARYFSLYDMAPVGYCTISKQGLLLEVNLTAANLLGVARGRKTVQLIFSQFIEKEDQDIYYRHRKQLFETGNPQTCELRMVKKDGASFWAHLSATVVQDEDESTICRVVISDITDRKRADEQLRISEEKFRHLVDDMAVGVLIQGLDTEIVLCNPKALELLGLSYDQLLGKTSFDPDWNVIHENGSPFPGHTHPVSQAISTRKPVRNVVMGVYRPTTCDRVWLLVDAEPQFDGDGTLHQVVVTFIDMTIRKQAENALRESEERFRLLYTAMDQGLALHEIITDADGNPVDYIFLDINDSYTRLLGVTREMCIGKRIKEVMPDVEQYWIDIFGKVALTGEPSYYENHLKTTGKYYSTYSYCPKKNQFAVLVNDISEQKNAENERLKLETQLQQAQKMESVGRLAGGVAHDFNNMLGVIIGHTEMALEQVDAAQPIHDDLMEIFKAANRSANLTRQLLAFARKQTVSPKVLDLNDTVKGMLNMLRRLIGEDIDLAWMPGAELWPVNIDPSQIDQMMANLCINARDAIADIGRITIETGNCAFDEAYCADHPGFTVGDYVRIDVSDTGCGMDKETQSHIFEPFFTTKGLGEGTGLGLATVYGAVKQNNGFITAYSEPGQGTAFTIYLPRHKGEPEPLTIDTPAESERLSNETILLVEDEPSILKLTTMMLTRQGYSVLAANTPAEAIRLAREHPGTIHLIMTDVVMPKMNGRDLSRNIQALCPDVKCLFMSGYTADVIAHQGVLDQAVHFIQKPFSKKDLIAKIREAIDSK